MYYMPMVTLRVTDDEKEAWVEQAGGARRLSEWIRARCNGTLTERDHTAGSSDSPRVTVPGSPEKGGHTAATPNPVSSGARSVSVPERPFHPDFKKPKAEAKKRRY